METSTNHHCSVVELDGVGVVIEGASGSGKTSLALALLEAANQNGIDAHFVCDDQTILISNENKVIANAPDTIQGKIEVYGFGIVSITHKMAAKVGLVVRLADVDEIDRMPNDTTANILGVDLPLVLAPAKHETLARRIVFAKLDLLSKSLP